LLGNLETTVSADQYTSLPSSCIANFLRDAKDWRAVRDGAEMQALEQHVE
jgi:hypothetical protein